MAVTSNRASPPTQIAVGTAAVPLLAANSKRKRLIIQNTANVAVNLVFGAVAPTATVYHMTLKAATGADDGTGVVYIDDMWQGDVWALSAGSATVVVTEFV